MLEIIGQSSKTKIIGNHEGLKGKIILHDANTQITLPKCNVNLDIQVWESSDISIIDLSGVERAGSIRITSKNGGSVSIAENSTIEQCYFLADGSDISVGRDCMISFGVSFRTTDAHGIYDIHTGERTNNNKSILLEDHVWVGQGCTISKGSVIETSTIIGGFSYLSNKVYERNSIYAGTPAKKIRDGVTWDRSQCLNIFDEDAEIDPYFVKNFDHFLGR